MIKHLLVTGGSQGIGFETVNTLAKSGHRVISVARSEERLQFLKNKFPDLVTILKADLSNSSGCEYVATEIRKMDDKLDGIIHNAGALINRSFNELTDENWQYLFNINVMAPVRLTRLLLDSINQGGHIVHISSMGGFQNSSKYPGLSAYSTTKGALAILSETLAVELSEFDIRSNCLCLGAVSTEMLREAFPDFTASVTASEMGNYVANFLLKGHKVYNGKILPVTLSDPG